MTVSTELAYAELSWTGAETSFPAGFPADQASDVVVVYRDVNGVETTLTLNTHFSVTLASGTKLVTVAPIALPAAPGTLKISRQTPATQGTDFGNLASYSPAVHTALHDRSAMRDAELRRDIADLHEIVDFPRYDISAWAVDMPYSGEVLLKHVFATTVAIPANLAGSQARSLVAAAASTVISIQKNGVEFATMTFGAGATTGTLAGAAREFVAGDALTIACPNPRDDALAGLSITLAGARTSGG